MEAFSKGEQRVVRLLLRGYTNAQIARHLGISVKGVKYHLTAVYAKAGVQSRSEFIVKHGAVTKAEVNDFIRLLNEVGHK